MIDLLCVGHASFDISMAVLRHPGPDEKIFAEAMQLAGGGPAANAAVCAARLGGSTAFFGYLGRDLFGDAHLAELQAEGVDTSLVVRGDDPTPLSQVLAKPDGMRSVVNFKGQTRTLPLIELPDDFRVRVMLFDGHEPDLSISLCRQAQAAAIPTVLDAGSLHRGTEVLAGMVDYVVASSKFAHAFTGSDDPETALATLAGIAPSVVITLGESGLIWHRDGERGRVPAFAIDAIDSTGAGDAFHGAFGFGLSQQMAWPDLLRYASAAGALTCTRLGARPALPDRSALSTLMAVR